MRIYTSNFHTVKDLVGAGIHPIGIARFEPKWYRGPNYKRLAPTGDMIRMSEEDYKPRFDIILSRLEVQSVVKDLEEIGGGKDVALLCYERPGEFCHRQMVANWLGAAGIEVVEWTAPVEEAPPSLFD